MNLVEQVVQQNKNHMDEGNSQSKKQAIIYLKNIKKNLDKAIKEFESDTVGDVRGVSASVVGDMVRVADQEWYEHYFK